MANYNYGVTGVYLGNGDGTLQTGQKYSVSAIALVGGDFNSDGITDLATASYSNANVTLLFGNPAKPLPVDATTGLESGFGRGNLTASTSDVDYFSWTGKAGDVVQAASENPGNPGSSGLTYQIENASGSVLTTLSSNSNDEGQSSPVTLPYSGTYLVEVSYDYGYSGEYRFRVTEAPPTVQLAANFDDSASSSPNTPALTNSSPGNATAQVAGYIGQGDANGDYYTLGNVVQGTILNLTLSQPAYSTLGGVLNIYNAAGTNLTNNTTAGNSLSYTVPEGGTYFARVSSASAMTVSFWMNWNGTNNECPISFPGYDLYLDNGFFGFNSASSDVYGISSAGLANSWHFVTAVFVDGSVTQDQLWIDGVQQTLTQRQNTTSPALVSTAAFIGGYNNSSSYFTGSLDEVAYFDTALNGTQILAEFNARNSGSYSTTILGQSPVAYYRLGESSGNVAYDSSGNFNNGTFGSGITLGAAGALGSDTNTAYQFSSGQISAIVPESTGILAQYLLAVDEVNNTAPQVTGTTLPVPGTASATINLSTGLDGNNNLIGTNGTNDSHWTVDEQAGGNAAAQVVTASGADWYSGWVADGPTSDWIARNANIANNGPALPYTFYRTFNLTGYNLADVSISGSWAVDDAGTLSLNGHPIASLGSGNYGSLSSFSVPAGSAFLNPGLNTLTITITSSDENLEGVRLVGSVTSAPINSTGIFNNFTVDYSEDMAAGNVNNLANYDLRAAGADGVFGTGDDQIYHLTSPGYTTGPAATFPISDGPLQAGNYQLTISNLVDRFGNVLPTQVIDFTVANLANYTLLGRSAHTLGTATPLTLTQDPAGAGLSLAAGRGALINTSDLDYWSFSGTAGNLLSIDTESLGSPASSGLAYVVTDPNGTTTLTSFDANSNGQDESTPIALPTTGTYTLRVSYNYQYFGEYDFRLLLATSPLLLDQEPNSTIATANALTLTANGNSYVANVAGTLLTSSDLNYFSLGTIQAGNSVLLTTQLPSTSLLSPVVSVYNAAGVYIPKTNGRAFDGVGQIDITTTGTYYALIQGGNATGGLFDQYVMNVQIVPTSSLAQLPNLEVTSISLPAGSSVQSGQSVTFSWTVTNEGQAATNVSNWNDRAVLSLDTTYGNGDDIALGSSNGVFGHTGVLAPGASYTARETVTLPDGITGNYYIIVQTDSSDQIDENAIGRGDNTTVSSGGANGNGTITINLAAYPDLTVQNLAANGPNANGTYTVSWNTVNSGNGAVPNNWTEQLVVTNQTTGIIVTTPLTFSGGLAANGGTAAHTEPTSGSYTIDAPGHFLVTVTTNSNQSIYEDNAQGHANAVQNDISSTTFDATRDLQVASLAVASPPSPQSGNLVTIGWNDTNTGNLATTGSWIDSITVLNTTTGVTLVNPTNVPYNGANIQPGGQAAQSYSFTLPSGSAGVGSIKVLVTVNSNNALAEFNVAGTAQTNNTAPALTFAAALAPYPLHAGHRIGRQPHFASVGRTTDGQLERLEFRHGAGELLV